MADQPLYEVEKLLDRKILPNKRVVYLVRWKGFSSDHDSWEPYSNLQTCRPLVRILKRALRDNDLKSEPTQSSVSDMKASNDAVENKPPGHKRGRKPRPKDGDLSIKKTVKKVKFFGHLRKSKYSDMLRAKYLNPNEDESLVHSEDSLKPSNMDSNAQISRDISKPGRKGFKRRKLETEGSNKDGKIRNKRKKKSSNENINLLNDSVTEVTTHMELNTEDEDDDSDILYSLNHDCDIANLDDVTNTGDFKRKKKAAKAEKNTGHSKAVITKEGSKIHSQKGTQKDGKRKTQILLMDSKKKSKVLMTKSGLMHSASIPPVFTTAKHLLDSPDSQNPSEPTGNCHREPVSPEASDTYLADVPSSYPVPAEEPHASEQSHSPRSLSYNSLLSNLPDQLHPLHKDSNKKAAGSNGDCVGSLNPGNLSPPEALITTSVGGEQVERRTSVRSTECAFRYKQIVVKKCVHYTQIWLNTQTVMKNALNPQVIQEVVSALNSAKYDDSHLVLFSSLGNVFCSGTDLHFLVSGDRKMSARQMADAIRELTKTIITFPKPIIAAVSGAAVGLGVSLLALCDVVYASDKASFHLPYSQLSQTPEGCASFTLPLTMGLPSANELLFGGRKITAMEGYQLGLVSQVFWPTLMMQEVIPRAQHMATCSAKALEATKLLVRSHHRTKMELTNETECNLLLERWLSVDCQRAIEAYLSNEKNLAF